MTTKWHSTRKEKPEADRVVVGFWIDADDEMTACLCYRDKDGSWYSAEVNAYAQNQLLQPKYWIEVPVKL